MAWVPGRKRHREGQRLAGSIGLVGQWFQGFRIADAGLLQLVVQGDRLTVAVEQPRHHHRLHRRTGQTHRGGERHADQHVCRLILAERQLVADNGPRGLFGDDRSDTEFSEVPQLVSHDDRRAIGQRDDAEPHRGRFGRIVRVDTAGPAARHAGKKRRGAAAGSDRRFQERPSRGRLVHELTYLAARKT
jgi:hypothetical protein